MNGGRDDPPPPPPPRAVSFWSCLALGKAKGFSFLLFLLLAAAMVILFAKIGRGLPPGPDAALDARHSLAKTGRLLLLPYPSHTRINGRRPWVLEFAYTLPQGREYRGYSYTFSRKLVEALAAQGSGLPVEYDPENPERARLAGTVVSYFPSWLFLIPLVFAGVTFFLGVWWIASSSKIHKLAVYGTPLQARIEEIRPVLGVNPPPWRITWTLVNAPPGVPPQGSALIPRRHPFARTHRQGDLFWVVADEFSGRAFPWIFREKTQEVLRDIQEASGGGGDRP